jgi:hypothetical protein
MAPEQIDTLVQLKKDGEARGVTGLDIWDKDRTFRKSPT